MNSPEFTHPKSWHLRNAFCGAFTLIELLVVISIIILLVTLTTSAVMKFRDTGPRTATRSNLKRIKDAESDEKKWAQGEGSSPTYVPDYHHRYEVAQTPSGAIVDRPRNHGPVNTADS